MRLAGRSPMSDAPKVRRAWIERPRGHSKTTDMAVQLTWVLKHARSRVQGLAAAADREQGALILRAANDLIASNPELCDDLKGLRDSLVNVKTGSRLDVLSSDVASSYGQLPDFVICDELCHWERPDLWYSLLSSAAKKPDCVLAVLTNAGVGQGWQWQAREAARASPGWHFSSLAGSQAPWIDAAALDEQRRLLPPAVFARLWENRWQHSDGEFVTLAEAEACRDDGLCEISRGRPDRFYFAAIDYAEKHDRTVGVVLHVEGDHLVVDRMDVAVPTPDRPVPVQWVEDWIAETARAFANVRFVVDEYQLLGTIQRLGARHDLKRFAFAAGAGNHALALTLRNLIVERKIRWPAGCGQLPECEARDDLETELASLVLRQAASGRVRIDHRREVGSHDDRAFALGAACLEGVLAGFQGEWIDVTEGLLQ
ncbi:MAG: terminase [Planctomycetaceae bacterium]|nr:terminase [Planctomycetaceae bacterium]